MRSMLPFVDPFITLACTDSSGFASTQSSLSPRRYGRASLYEASVAKSSNHSGETWRSPNCTTAESECVLTRLPAACRRSTNFFMSAKPFGKHSGLTS